MLIGMYVVEGIILLLWYNLIIKKEIYENEDKKKGNEKKYGEEGTVENNVNNKKKDEKVVIRTIRLLKKYRKEIRDNLLLRVNYCQEKKENIEKIKKYVGNVFYSITWLTLIAIVCPIIMDAIPMFKDNVMGYVLGIIVILGMLFKELRACTQNYIEALKIYIKQVLIPLENATELVSIDEKEIIRVEWTRKKKLQIILMVSFCVLLFLLLMWVEKIMTNNVMIGRIAACLLVFAFLMDYVKDKFPKRQIKDVGIVFNGCEYFSIEEQIKDFCKKLNINNLKCSIWEENGNAFSHLDEDGIWEIALSRGLLLELEDMHRKGKLDIREGMLIIVGHEIGHAFYRDTSKNINKRVGIAIVINLVIWVMVYMFTILAFKSTFFFAIGGFLMLFSAIFGNVMCDGRYWLQIAELKADRIAISLFDGGKEAFVRYFGRENRIKEEEARKEKIDKANVFYRYYKHDVEIEGHPSIKRRIELVEKRKKWKWWEYFEHALLIRMWRWNRLGWNGIQ